jgi:hypothetical protein
MSTYIVYDLNSGSYFFTVSEEVANEAIPSEDTIVADVSHWDYEDVKDFDSKHSGHQIGQLEGIELVDEIRAELARRPL